MDQSVNDGRGIALDVLAKLIWLDQKIIHEDRRPMM
jgi:hypothetical protein